MSIQGLNWANGINNTRHDVHNYADPGVKEYYKQWLIHFSKEAEVTNLVADVIMLESFSNSIGANILIFCNCQTLPSLPEVDTGAPFIKSLIEHINTKSSVIDLWEFSFANFALAQGYLPKDQNKYGANGHPGESAHWAFGKFLLEKYQSIYR